MDRDPVNRDSPAAIESELVYARELLRRALEDFVPNHDEANALANRIGLGDLPHTDLIAEIREFLDGDRHE